MQELIIVSLALAVFSKACSLGIWGVVMESGLKDEGDSCHLSVVPCSQAPREKDFLAETVVTGQGAMVLK